MSLLTIKMGKQEPGRAQLTPTEALRRASRRLERHIFNAQATTLRRTLRENPLLPYPLQQKCHRLLTLAKDSSNGQPGCQATSQPPFLGKKEEDKRTKDDGEEASPSRPEPEEDCAPLPLHPSDHLNRFEELLEQSEASYAKSKRILGSESLKERYAHLLGKRTVERVRNEPDGEDRATLRRIRGLFGQYRVSSMFRGSLCAKIRAGVVERLVEQGWLGLRRVGDREIVWLRD